MEQTVVVTGFGAFRDVENNPSSIIVDRIEELGIPDFNGKVITQKVSVDYCEVEKTVEQLWSEHEPSLVVHIGVHPDACNQVRLEKQAFRHGYYYGDVNDKTPEDYVAHCSDKESLCCSMDLDEVARIVNKSLGDDTVTVVTSEDPGRYLCSYIYYHSLSKMTDRTLFIHVSEFNDVCTLELETDIVCKVITELLKQQETCEIREELVLD